MNDSPMRCAMTGVEIRNSGDGVWDDGEWISWAYINEQLDLQENGPAPELVVEDGGSADDIEPDSKEPDIELLNRIRAARNHFENTLDQISPDWGRIGEDYVAQQFGVKLSRMYTQGHDGRWGDELVEIKTITPHKHRPFVRVKLTGNFNILAIVKIAADDTLDVRFISRSKLPAGTGRNAHVVAWSTACRIGSMQLIRE
ncbi:hypothetical protein Verru16b_00301 [Lacunisphaera limnophila]|uniref:Uncharacterized protein n=1 Tax=Lacunisphaera limnophila TaxID=1838286 RepID=A0A1I7PI06_9BACT|nr:hypothetical protein [Lacunisphaera limnophila]AOS43258.1 hypothetical protein Verru16b_00301 [Lacunisphaera limnophila]